MRIPSRIRIFFLLVFIELYIIFQVARSISSSTEKFPCSFTKVIIFCIYSNIERFFVKIFTLSSCISAPIQKETKDSLNREANPLFVS